MRWASRSSPSSDGARPGRSALARSGVCGSSTPARCTMTTMRSHGEGSLFQRGRDRKWVASVTMPDGKRRSRSARSKAEGLVNLRELTRQRDAAVPRDPQVERLGPYLQRWLADVQPRLAPATYRKHESICRVHLVPALGHRRLSELSVADVRDYLRHKRLDPQTVRHHRATLRRALADAQRDALISRNVAIASMMHLDEGNHEPSHAR